MSTERRKTDDLQKVAAEKTAKYIVPVIKMNTRWSVGINILSQIMLPTTLWMKPEQALSQGFFITEVWFENT